MFIYILRNLLENPQFSSTTLSEDGVETLKDCLQELIEKQKSKIKNDGVLMFSPESAMFFHITHQGVIGTTPSISFLSEINGDGVL